MAGDDFPQPKASRAGSRPTVLIVEDNADNLALIVDYLATKGFAIFTASDGDEALRLVGELRPDMVLMDMHMPGLDGFEAIRRIREDERFATTPIVALTALAMIGDRERCLAAGASDYVSKPVSLRRLAEVVNSYL